jgi:hypothetical protein
MITDRPQAPPPVRAHRQLRRGRDRKVLVVVLCVLGVVGLLLGLSTRQGGTETVISDEAAFRRLAVASVIEVEASGAPSIEAAGCTVDTVAIEEGDEGDAVTCAQRALTAAGVYTGPITGVFDDATDVATREYQRSKGLYVDGVVGGNTATALGIWPGDDSFVVRTPPPAEGATDLWGVALSSVASAGDDAPPMPPDSGQGTGKRVVYDRAGQRVWAVDDQERVVRSYLVTGSKFNNETPGEHRVYSRSEMTTAWNGEADLPLMIRYLDTERGAIGFHAIPLYKSNGLPYQTEAELGQKLSGGCQRQANLDAEFLWGFATEGTRVIVT